MKKIYINVLVYKEFKPLPNIGAKLLGVNNTFNDYIKNKPANYADISKNKNLVNSLINLNTYINNAKSKATSLNVVDKFNTLESKLQNEAKNIGITNLNTKIDVNKIATNLNIKYKNWLTAKQKSIKLAEEQKKIQQQKQYVIEHPSNLKNLCEYVISNIKKSYSNSIDSVEIFDGYDGSMDGTIMFKVTLQDTLAPATNAKMIATDMIFDAYKKTFENNLNTKSVLVHVWGADGVKGLTACLGRGYADSSKDTITSNTASSYGGTNFINLLKQYNIDSFTTSDPTQECFANGSYSED